MPDKLYDLYMRYGDDYKSSCEKFAIDTLNDAATKHNAKQFFNEFVNIT